MKHVDTTTFVGRDAKSKNLLVVGGADGIGNWLVRRVFAKLPDIQRITLLDVKAPHEIPHPRFAKEIGQLEKPIDALSIERDASDDEFSPVWSTKETRASSPAAGLPFSAFDVVMFAVPEQEMPRSAATIVPLLRPGTWIFDVCSVKQAPLEALVQVAAGTISIVGTHPLFGPAVNDVVGQTVVLVKTTEMQQEHYDWLYNVFNEQGALVVESSAVAHDNYMLYVQTLTHFLYLAFSKTLHYAMQEGFDLEESFKYMTPPYASIVAFMGRLINGNPRLYAQIQSHEMAGKPRALFIRAVHELSSIFDERDEMTSKSAILNIARPFRGRDVARGVSIASAFVERIQNYYEDIYERKQQGGLTVIKISDPVKQEGATYHIGRILGYDNEYLIIGEQYVEVNGKYFVVYDKDSREAFELGRKSRGIGLPKFKEVKIHHKRAQILSPEETRLWRLDNLQHHQFDIPVIADKTVDLNHVLDGLSRLSEDIISIEANEAKNAAWLGRYNLANWILRCTVFGDRDPQPCQRLVIQNLERSGMYVHTSSRESS